jgi:ADP-ribose pyrophosphatase YjhB (NUDIX family)
MLQRRRIAAYGLVRDSLGRVLLVRGSTRDDEPGVWYLPGGGVEHGERPRDAVIREYAEETGLAVDIVTLRDLITDLVPRVDRGQVVHTDRVIYDVRVAGGTLCNETDGTSDLAEWVDPERLGELPLAPYVARTLGLSVTQSHQVPNAEPDLDPARTRRQRFAAYGVATDPAGRVLLTRIAKGYPGAGTWHLPGGGTDFGEQATTGLLREMVEETAQRGRVTGLLAVSHYHNRRAMGPEGRPMDWHTVRALYRVIVDEPSVPTVTEAMGGSTAEAAWVDPAELAALPLNEFARAAVNEHLG